YQEVPAYIEATAEMPAADRARVAARVLEETRKSGDLIAAGFLMTTVPATALGNNKGLFAYHPGSDADYTLTVRTNDGTGSGWASGGHNDVRKVDFDGVSTRAVEKARKSRQPTALEPGRYVVILEPQAVSDLIPGLAFSANARSADEGRSPFSK